MYHSCILPAPFIHIGRVMYAVVSQLDPIHDALVRGLWSELELHYRLRLAYPKPIAHISYMVFEDKPEAGLKERLQNFASNHEPFDIRAGGLGLFPGSPAILYLPVVRSAQLTVFHQRLWREMNRDHWSPSVLYHPERWIPHISLAQLNLQQVGVADVIVDMAERRLDWQCTISSLALINGVSLTSGLDYVLPFSRARQRTFNEGLFF